MRARDGFHQAIVRSTRDGHGAVTPSRGSVLLASPLKGRPGGGPRRLAPTTARRLAPTAARRRGRRLERARVLLGAAMVTLAFGGGAAPAAQADSQPAILKAYGLDWIERVREEAWPQPKAQRPVICLLDTGVAITPDTPADNPEGPIVARLSVEDPLPGSTERNAPAALAELGLPQGSSYSHLHGTRMAALIGAPRNQAGIVGVFPQAKIVSIRVTRASDVFITPADVEAGVRECQAWALRSAQSVAAVVMAEALYEHRVEETNYWSSAAAVARSLRALFVVAGGNQVGAEAVVPATQTGAIVVGGGDDSGQLCAFSEGTRIDLIGPGCSKAVPGLWSGSSTATAVVGAVVGAIKARAPTLSEVHVRQLIGVNGEGAGRLAGAAVRELFPNQVGPTDDGSAPRTELVIERPGVSSTGPEQVVRLWRPGIQVSWRRGRLVVRRTTKRNSGVLVVRVPGRSEGIRVTRAYAELRIQRRVRTVEVWAESKDGKTWRSLSRRVRVK